MGNGDVIDLVAMDDPMYNLRQVEVILKSGGFPWYDPMTLMPTGMYPHWGVLFPYILAVACIIGGASTLSDIITISLFIPPLMAVAMIPTTYLLVKKSFDWKTGIISAIFIATIAGQYFTRSLFGYLDHHIAEVLFGSIFCLAYLATIIDTKDDKIDFKTISTLKKPLLYSSLAGISYLLGFLVMPTMILFGFIVLLYTITMFIASIKYKVNRESLLILNTLTFGIPILGFYIMGYPVVSWFQLSHYSNAHPFVWALMIGMTIILYAITTKFSEISNKINEFVSPVMIIAAAILVIVMLFHKYMYNILQGSIVADSIEFFGQSAVISTVQEARAWSVQDAWGAFNFFLILMFIGLAILAHAVFTKKRGEHVFIYIWTLVMLVATLQHIRYEYFLSINLAILSAIAVGYFVRNIDISFITSKFNTASTKLSMLDPQDITVTTPTPPDAKKKSKKSPTREKSTKKEPINIAKYSAFIGLCVVIAISAMAVLNGVMFGYAIGQSNAIRLNPDWKESLIWMGKNTPDTGVDYYTLYDSQTFKYPESAYGVMSWWDYGHMITFISHRIPNANPFQAGVYGNYSASSFFMSQSEEHANEILDNLKTKYIVTDTEMATGKFWAMATWYNPKSGQTPYIKSFIVPKSPTSTDGQIVQGYTPDFYMTMITRLHLFDGASFNSQDAIYVEYDPATSRVFTATQMPLHDAITKSLTLKQSSITTKAVAIISPDLMRPIGQQNTLKHYRLIHESPSSTITGDHIDVKYVKTFEYVNGYYYTPTTGTGMILFAEQDITTNTGRSFKYRQEISGTEFILPYPGIYTISDVNGNVIETITVTENNVNQGKTQ
jgi:dolichyl-diphosphooligosaccharide--protein glycosyltransferase